jgi:hypothetical protein
MPASLTEINTQYARGNNTVEKHRVKAIDSEENNEYK